MGIRRMPANTYGDAANSELQNLTDTQRHDVYASIVATRGNDAARNALTNGDRVILGLRQEDSTLATGQTGNAHLPRADDPATRTVDESQRGTGIYNDRLVVLWENADGTRGVHETLRASTEPTAQYDAHYASNRSVPYRRAEGEDVNRDRTSDMGRLAPGTIEMKEATHGDDGHDAFRPTRNAVAAGADMVQRDTNGDGRFDGADVNGVQDLNDTFKIHRGSRNNTDSAGCQTIHPDEYRPFVDAVSRNAGDNPTWQYVLTNTTPSDTPVVDRAAPMPATAPQGRPDGPGPSQYTPEAGDQSSRALIERLLQASESNDPQALRLAQQGLVDSPLGRQFQQETREQLQSERAIDEARQPTPSVPQHEAPVMQR